MKIDAQKVTRLREARGLSKQGLADASGICRRTVYNIEFGHVQNPTLAICIQLGKAMRVPVTELMPDDVDSAPTNAALAAAVARIVELEALMVTLRSQAQVMP